MLPPFCAGSDHSNVAVSGVKAASAGVGWPGTIASIVKPRLAHAPYSRSGGVSKPPETGRTRKDRRASAVTSALAVSLPPRLATAEL